MEDRAQRAAYPGGARWCSILLPYQPTGRYMAALTGTLAERASGMIKFHQQNEQAGSTYWYSRYCNAPDFGPIAGDAPFPENCSTVRVTPRDRLKFHHPYRKAALRVPRNRAKSRCARSWCNLPPTLFRQRALGMYNSGRNQLTSDLLDQWSKGNVRQQHAAQYGRALQAMEASSTMKRAKRCSRC